MRSDLEARPRAVSLRVTRPRSAVLAALRARPQVDTDAVTALVRVDHPTVSHQAIYDVLPALTDAGPVRRVEPAGASARYGSRVGDNHHHVVCRLCDAIADVDRAVGHTPCPTASRSPSAWKDADERSQDYARLQCAGGGPEGGGRLSGRA